MIAGYLVGIDIVQLTTWLAEAQQARHALATGQHEVSVSYEGKSVTFAQADIGRLDVYIAELLKAIAALSGVTYRRGPVYAAF